MSRLQWRLLDQYQVLLVPATNQECGAAVQKLTRDHTKLIKSVLSRRTQLRQMKSELIGENLKLSVLYLRIRAPMAVSRATWTRRVKEL